MKILCDDTVCSRCGTFLFADFIGQDLDKKPLQNITSSVKLSELRIENCEICRGLNESLPLISASLPRPDRPITHLNLTASTYHGLKADYFFATQSESDEESQPWFIRQSCSNQEECTLKCPVRLYSDLDKLPTTSDSQQSWEWLDQMWKECQDDLQPNLEHMILPSRILELDHVSRTLRLIDQPTWDKVQRYACLSHCWGPPGVLRLRTVAANIERMRTGLSLNELPSTFRDTVRICERLKLNYLWIDSICIIQDQKEDWAKECLLMGRIYHNAVIVISATAAGDCNGGCFQAYPELPTFKTSPGTVCKYEHTFYLINHTPHEESHIALSALTPVLPEAEMSTWFPLLARAWCFQERNLARRVLHCMRGEFIWEDERGLQWQCRWPEDEFGDFSQSRYYRDHPRDAVEKWKSLIHRYCEKKLTYVTDKLPALSGLAEFHWYGIRSRYIVGLWQDWLLEPSWLLLWSVIGKRNPRPKTWLGPTWSWVSVENNARFSSAGFCARLNSVCKIQDLALVCDGDNDLSKPVSAKIIIRGCILPFRNIDHKGKSTYLQPLEQVKHEDWLPSEATIWLDVTDPLDNDYSASATSAGASNIDKHPVKEDLVFFLLLAYRAKGEDKPALGERYYGLLLRCLDPKLDPSLVENAICPSQNLDLSSVSSNKYQNLLGNALFERIGYIHCEKSQKHNLENWKRFEADIAIV